MLEPILPTGEPIIGRQVRLDLLAESDLDEMYPLLSDPEVYASGYVMHRRPTSLADARELAWERFLALQGRADGRGAGRTAYAIRLVADSELGPAGALVGTSSLWEANLYNESIHLGSTLYGRHWWGTQVNPEAKLLLMTRCFRRLRVRTRQDPDRRLERPFAGRYHQARRQTRGRTPPGCEARGRHLPRHSRFQRP